MEASKIEVPDISEMDLTTKDEKWYQRMASHDQRQSATNQWIS